MKISEELEKEWAKQFKAWIAENIPEGTFKKYLKLEASYALGKPLVRAARVDCPHCGEKIDFTSQAVQNKTYTWECVKCCKPVMIIRPHFVEIPIYEKVTEDKPFSWPNYLKELDGNTKKRDTSL